MSNQKGGKLPTVNDMVEQEHNLKAMKLPRDNNDDGYFYRPSNFFAHYKNPLMNGYFDLYDFPSKQIDTSGDYNSGISFSMFKNINILNADNIMTFSNNYQFLNVGQKNIDLGKHSNDNSAYLRKKVFYDIMTDLFNRDLINDDQKKIFAFQSIVINKFNKLIDDYRKSNNLSKDELFFQFKGGTTMRIITNQNNGKYKDYFNINVPNITEYFKRSDSDYQINLAKEVVNFNYHYYNICKIVFVGCNDLYKELNQKVEQFFNFDFLTEKKLKDILKEGNEELKKHHGNNIKEYRKIKKLVGVQILDKMYYNINGNEQYINKNNAKQNVGQQYNVSEIFVSDNDTDVTILSNQNFSNNILDIKKSNFYITTKNKNMYYTKIDDDKNYIYMYLNETTRFLKNDNIISFNLYRIKAASCFIYETVNKKYGILFSPSEIIDISFPKLSHYKMYKISKKNNYIEYNYNTHLGNLQFYGYNLEGFINDLNYILYFDVNYEPWKDIKYQKRLIRLFIFLIYKIYAFSNDINVRKMLIQNLQDIATKNKTPLSNDFNNDQFFTSIHTMLQKTMNKPNSVEKQTYINTLNNDFFAYILNDLPQIPPQKLIEDGQIDYLQKYMSYKKKYYELKQKLNK